MAGDPSRSTPHGFWRFSANYLLSAEILYRNLHSEGHVYLPTLNTYALAIELSLKAFLMKRGHSLSKMRKLGHGISTTLDLARHHKLGRIVKLTKAELDAIHVLDITYSIHRLRYIETGVIRLPHLIEVSRAARSLVVGLEEYCTGRRGRIDPNF